MKMNHYGGLDENGNILCLKCKEYTNSTYIQVPNLVCWNCEAPLLGSHVDTIKSFQKEIIELQLKSKIEMAKTVRAKFNVSEIAKYGNMGGIKVTLSPVIGGSEENKAFWQHTPVGKIEMHISNPDAVFEFGEYYVDFTKAE